MPRTPSAVLDATWSNDAILSSAVFRVTRLLVGAVVKPSQVVKIKINIISNIKRKNVILNVFVIYFLFAISC